MLLLPRELPGSLIIVLIIIVYCKYHITCYIVKIKTFHCVVSVTYLILIGKEYIIKRF